MMQQNKLVLIVFFAMAVLALYGSMAPPPTPMSPNENLFNSGKWFDQPTRVRENERTSKGNPTSSPASSATDPSTPGASRKYTSSAIDFLLNNDTEPLLSAEQASFVLPDNFPRPEMTLQLERPGLNQVVDVFSVTSKCDFHLTTTQECLDYLNSNSRHYLTSVSDPLPPCDDDHPLLYHAYWRGLMGPTVTWMLKSFLFTQNLNCSRYILWVDASNTPLDFEDIDRKAQAEMKSEFEAANRREEALADWQKKKENATKHGLPPPPPPPIYTPIYGHSHGTHGVALREILAFSPFVTIKRFNLSDTLIRTLRLSSEEMDDFLRARDSPPPPPPPAPQDDPVGKADETKDANTTQRTIKATNNDKPDTTPTTTTADTGGKQIVGPKPPRFNWPVNLLNPKSNLRGNAVSDSDLVRFILLDVYGGMYIDTDVLFLRDMRPWYYMRANWAYAWSMWNYYNTAFLMFQRDSQALSDIISKGIANGMKFHPKELLAYIRGPDQKHLATLTGEHQLAMFPSAVFDTMWTYVDGNKKTPILPTFDKFNVLFEQKCDRAKEFAVLAKRRDAAYVRNAHIRELRSIENFMPGAPANHFHGIVHKMETDSWASILLEHYNCFLAAKCPNIYGEVLPESLTT